MKIPPYSKLVMIGDSITDCGRVRPIAEGARDMLGNGYVSLVHALIHAAHPEHPLRVVNIGIGGDTVRELAAADVPLVLPTGGHAVYLDAREMLPHIPPLHYPGWSLGNALYLLGGIRGVEIGTVMFGLHPDGTESAAAMDLVRLAFPRRVYTQSHVDYLAEIIIEVYNQRDALPGYRIVSQSPILRHFTARLEPIRGGV